MRQPTVGQSATKVGATFEAETQLIKHNYDAYARHLINTERHNAGWMYRTTSGDWAWDQKDTVLIVCATSSAYPRKCPDMSWAKSRPALIHWSTNPISPNSFPATDESVCAHFAIVPTHNGNHPHYDMILRHIGQGLDKAVKRDEWCQQYGITTGYDFLLLWCAILVKDPKQHLPMLYLQPRRDNGKSAFHKGMGLLFFRGYVSGVLAMNEKFNKLLAGAILVYLDEEARIGRKRRKVKLYIDADKIEMRLMRTDPFMFDNFTHWIAAYNFTDGIYVEDGDERIIMVEVPTFTRRKVGLENDNAAGLESERADFSAR